MIRYLGREGSFCVVMKLIWMYIKITYCLIEGRARTLLLDMNSLHKINIIK